MPLIFEAAHLGLLFLGVGYPRSGGGRYTLQDNTGAFMAIQHLFGAPATLMTGPEDSYAAVFSFADKAVVLRSEAGRRISRYPVHQGQTSAEHVLAELTSQGFQVQLHSGQQFAERAGFVSAHLRPISH